MTKPVTEEMISAFIDGELSPEDKLLVENAISTDVSMRNLFESFKESSQALKASSRFVTNTATLPGDFSARIMSRIHSDKSAVEGGDLKSSEASVVTEVALTESPNPDSNVGPEMGRTWQKISMRTWIEVLVASVAILIIISNWPTSADHKIAQPQQDETDGEQPKNGVRMLGSKNGQFKQADPSDPNKTTVKHASPSREFSIFINSDTRPQVDRFWIMNNYEVSAPENAEPNGSDAKVNMLMIDSKRADAVKFFSELPKWDSGFQVFQESKSGSASWLAPFDVSKAKQAEGDFWTLKIILIEK